MADSTGSSNFSSGSRETAYAAVEPFRGTTNIPHHAEVESAEEGARNGRLFVGVLAAPKAA